MNEYEKAEEIVRRYKKLYEIRLLRKRFIPIEKIAKEPTFYGYDLPQIDSKAKQEKFILDKSKVVAAICANRAGKTEAGAVKFLQIIMNHKTGGNAWVLSESFDLQKTGTQEKILEYLKSENIIHIDYLRRNIIKSIEIKNKYGAKINLEFKSYEQGERKLQSAKLIAAWIDEEPPEEIYDEVYMRTIDYKAQIIMTFTPLRGLTWSYKRIFNNKSSKIAIYNWGMADNPFIAKDEIEELLNTLSPRKAKMRLYGQYQGSEKMILDNFDRSLHVKTGLYDDNLPVDVSVDWGVVTTCIGFFQSRKIIDKLNKSKIKEEHYLIDAIELSGAGYPSVMKYILTKGYNIDNYYCDPAARGRSQATKIGISLLKIIQNEYNINFTYIKSLGVEESCEILNSYFMNAKKEVRFYFNDSILLNKDGDLPAQRVENYVRDEETSQPIKDGINDHFCDMLRYYIANKVRRNLNVFRQE